jgi:fucokinase
MEAAPAPHPGAWVVVSAPLRIDLAGGWTDTPPISFEHGGAVTNLAIKIDGKRPLGARARRLPEAVLRLVVGDTTTECWELSDLADFGTPQAPAALLKVCLICLGIVDMKSSLCLAEQLQRAGAGDTLGGIGIELSSTSNVPTGSGLGTSSILAAFLLAAASMVVGMRLSNDSLVHAVLS